MKWTQYTKNLWATENIGGNYWGIQLEKNGKYYYIQHNEHGKLYDGIPCLQKKVYSVKCFTPYGSLESCKRAVRKRIFHLNNPDHP